MSTPKPSAAAVTKPTEALTTSAHSISLNMIHDILHQVGLLREALRSEKRRLGFFLGAGCPLGIFDEKGDKSVKHIPDVAGLTATIEDKLAADTALKPLRECWQKLMVACKSDTCKNPNVEHILTQLRTICALKGSSAVDGMTTANLRNLDVKICDLIVELVGKSLPKYKTSYHRFAVWVRQLERTYPLEIFTPNYDLLVEEAFEQFRVPFFDGFVGSREPFFDLAAMEQDKVPERWARLWKLHGSINWIKLGDDSVFRCHPPKPGQQVMIYPSHLKYEQSRRMPYLAMCDRLKAFFRETNPVIVLCGYSFADDHLNELLLDGLRGNRSAHCFALMYSTMANHEQAVKCAEKLSNLTLLAWDGAVVATRSGAYKRQDAGVASSGSGIDVEKGMSDPDGKDTYHTRCILGDFHHFSLFLETQFGVRSFE
jgi:hypothetical protein